MTVDEARNSIGAAVVYEPHPGAPREDGVIRGVSSQVVFVHYAWQRPDAHAQGTPAEALTFAHGASAGAVHHPGGETQ